MAIISLDVTKYLVDDQLPADTVCEWVDGLKITVGRSRNEFGNVFVDFHGSRPELAVLIDRYEENGELAANLRTEIRDN